MVISTDSRPEKHSSGFPHFLDRTPEVPGTSEAPLDVPPHAGCHCFNILGNGGIGLLSPTRQLPLPHVEFLNVFCEEISSRVHGFLKINSSFFFDDGDEVVCCVTAGLFFVIAVDILQTKVESSVLWEQDRPVMEEIRNSRSR